MDKIDSLTWIVLAVLLFVVSPFASGSGNTLDFCASLLETTKESCVPVAGAKPGTYLCVFGIKDGKDVSMQW